MSRREYPQSAYTLLSPSNIRKNPSNNINISPNVPTLQHKHNSEIEFTFDVNQLPIESKKPDPTPVVNTPKEQLKTIENNTYHPTNKEIRSTIKKRQINDFGMMGNHPGISPNSPILELGGLMPQNYASPSALRRTPSPTFPYRVQGNPFPLPEFQIHPSFCQTSMNFIPKTQSLLDKLAIPISFDIRPLSPHIVCYFMNNNRN